MEGYDYFVFESGSVGAVVAVRLDGPRIQRFATHRNGGSCSRSSAPRGMLSVHWHTLFFIKHYHNFSMIARVLG